MSTVSRAAEAARIQSATPGADGPVVAAVVEQPESEPAAGELEQRVATLESYIDAVASAVDEAAKLEARVAALEARTREATINADIVSLQGKVTGLEDQVGARLAQRIRALEDRAALEWNYIPPAV